MSRLFVYLVRFALMILGFAAAALSASVFIHVMLIGVSRVEGDEFAGMIAGSMFVSIPFVALLVAYYAFVPAIVVLVLAELLRRRDWLFYALGGAAASLPFMARMLPTVPADSGAAEATMLAMALGAGMVGGIVYWLVAGRSAGGWREQVDG